jgi:hypothetical protein
MTFSNLFGLPEWVFYLEVSLIIVLLIAIAVVGYKLAKVIRFNKTYSVFDKDEYTEEYDEEYDDAYNDDYDDNYSDGYGDEHAVNYDDDYVDNYYDDYKTEASAIREKLSSMTVKDLRVKAKELKVKNWWRETKHYLVEEIITRELSGATTSHMV